MNRLIMYVHKGQIVFAGVTEFDNVLKSQGKTHLQLQIDTLEIEAELANKFRGSGEQSQASLEVIVEMTRIHSMQSALEFLLTKAYQLGKKDGKSRKVKKQK